MELTQVYENTRDHTIHYKPNIAEKTVVIGIHIKSRFEYIKIGKIILKQSALYHRQSTENKGIH